MAAIAYPRQPAPPARTDAGPRPFRGPLGPHARRPLPSGVYWRRRALALLALAVAVLFLVRMGTVVLGGGPLTAPEGPGGSTPAAAQVYVVQPGDTVWSIAHRFDPEGDERPLVAEITAELGGATVQPGQAIRIP